MSEEKKPTEHKYSVTFVEVGTILVVKIFQYSTSKSTICLQTLQIITRKATIAEISFETKSGTSSFVFAFMCIDGQETVFFLVE